MKRITMFCNDKLGAEIEKYRKRMKDNRIQKSTHDEEAMTGYLEILKKHYEVKK